MSAADAGGQEGRRGPEHGGCRPALGAWGSRGGGRRPPGPGPVRGKESADGPRRRGRGAPAAAVLGLSRALGRAARRGETPSGPSRNSVSGGEGRRRPAGRRPGAGGDGKDWGLGGDRGGPGSDDGGCRDLLRARAGRSGHQLRAGPPAPEEGTAGGRPHRTVARQSRGGPSAQEGPGRPRWGAGQIVAANPVPGTSRHPHGGHPQRPPLPPRYPKRLVPPPLLRSSVLARTRVSGPGAHTAAPTSGRLSSLHF